MGTRERAVETYLGEQLSKLGGSSWKWVGQRGVPDRMCGVPGVGLFGVEVKTADGVLEDHQARTHTAIICAGGRVATVYGSAGVDKLITEIEGFIASEGADFSTINGEYR